MGRGRCRGGPLLLRILFLVGALFVLVMLLVLVLLVLLILLLFDRLIC